MKRVFLSVSLAIIALPAFAATEAEVMDLAKKNGCLACHAVDKKLVGPAWKDIGKKYAGDSEAEARLLVKVKKGSNGVWGAVPMPPNATVKDADIKTLVQFVLSLR